MAFDDVNQQPIEASKAGDASKRLQAESTADAPVTQKDVQAFNTRYGDVASASQCLTMDQVMSPEYREYLRTAPTAQLQADLAQNEKDLTSCRSCCNAGSAALKTVMKNWDAQEQLQK